MKVTIETIPYSEQRYDTWGDWWFNVDKSDLTVKVSESGNWRSSFLVGIHEAIEAMLCLNDGVTGEEVDAFDLAHLDSDQPGAEKDAPYYDQHFVADVCERIACQAFGIKWDDHDNTDYVNYKK